MREQVWKFTTPRFEIAAYVQPEQYTPDWLEGDEQAELLADIEAGRLAHDEGVFFLTERDQF